MGASKTITINAEVDVSLSGMKNVVNELQQGLRQGISKLDLSKGMGKDLSKLMSQFEDEASKLEKLTLGNVLNLEDAKAFEKSGSSIIKTFKEIQRIVSTIETKKIGDIKNLFPEAFDSRVDNLKNSLRELQTTINSMDDNISKRNIKQKEYNQLSDSIIDAKNSLEALLKDNKVKQISDIENAFESTGKTISDLEKKLKGTKSSLKKTIEENFSSEKLKEYQEAIEQIQKEREKVLGKEAEKYGYKGGHLAYDGKTIKKLREEGKEEQAASLEAWGKQEKEIKRYQNLLKIGKKLQKIDFTKDSDITKAVEGLKQAEISFGSEIDISKIDKLNEALNKQAKIREALNKARELENSINKQTDDLNQTEIDIDKINRDIQTSENAKKQLQSLGTTLKSLLGESFSDQLLDGTAENIGKIISQLENLEEIKLNNLIKHIQNFGTESEEALQSLLNTDNVLKNVGKDIDVFQEREQDIANLKRRMLDFFSISNSIEIFKRTIRESFETVKELDAVMTETAVVTDFTVGDMWEKLPQYAKQASALGTSIKDLYSATTLYYQQGLNSDQAMSVGVETMKMARIANMDASEATQAMTAALRGFNMEINESSATRINDVYSELAAITAADTNQIATAMTKTASIADSANMEFETTAALLAQIIETTQEAPETAGTAMKTIIARFTEVKKLFDEGMLSGEDEEGEAIEINKIDTALKTVGISLKDFLRGEKGIDDIFLELASKWDTLDLATQRYIATTAAGSRQQSRFIAMMSNYERTMELVNAANNSAGASQNQYEKTLDSMEAKLQKLQNAWDTFVMGLANNEVLKGGIDFLTKILDTVNSLTDALSGGNGLTKSFISLMTIIGALKGGDFLLQKALGYVGSGLGIEQKQIPQKQSTSLNPFKFQQISEQSFGYMPLNMLGQGLSKFVYENETLEEKLNKTTANIENLEKEMNTASQIQENVRKRAAVNWTDKNDQAYSNASKNSQRIKKELEKEKLTKEQIEQQIIEIPKSFEKGQMVSTIVTGVGFLSSSLASIAKNNNLEGLGAALETIGTAGIFAGQGIGIMNQALSLGKVAWKDFGKVVIGGFKTFWPAILAIAAIGGAAYVAYQQSPEGQLKAAEKRTEQVTKGAENAAESYNNLSESVKNIGTQSEELDKLTKGTQEWNEAANNVNQATIDLIGQHEELSEKITYTDGVLTLDKEVIDAYLKKEELDVIKAQSAKLNAELLEAQARRKTITSSDFIKGYTGVALKDIEQQEIPEGPRTGIQTSPYYQSYSDGKIINEKVTNEIADLIAKGLIENREKLEEHVSENEIEMIISDSSFEQLRAYGLARQANELQIEQKEREISQSIKEQARIQGTLDEFGENLDDSLISAIRDANYEKVLSEMILDFSAYKSFAGIMEYTYLGGLKFKDKEGNIQEIDRDTISQTLAAVQADSDTANQLDLIDDKFEKDYSKELLLEILGQDGNQITSKTWSEFAEVFDEEGELLTEQFANIIGEGTWKDLAEKIGTTPEELQEVIEDNFKSAKDRIVKSRKKLAENMEKYSLNELGNYNDVIGALQVQLGDDILNRANDLITAVERTGDNQVASHIYSTFEAQALKAVASEGVERQQWQDYLQQTEEFVDNIDWSNSINAFAQLAQYSKTGTDYTKNFANSILNLDSSFLNIGNQFKTLTSSEDFSEIQKDLTEIYESQGKITEADVQELAQSYKQLDKFMDNTSTTAEGLAELLTQIQDGEIGLENVTSAVLAAVGSINSLGEATSKALQGLEDFNLGKDLGQIQDTYTQWGDLLKEFSAGGEFGNEQYHNILDRVFGDDWDSDLTTDKEYATRMQKLTQHYQEIFGNGMGQAWIQAALGYDIEGNYILEGAKGVQEALAEYGYTLTTNGEGEITFQVPEGETFAQVAENLTEVFGGTTQLWADMLSFYTNMSPMMSETWMQADYNNMGQAALDEARSFSGKKYLTEDEVNTIATTVAKDRGKEVEEVRQDLINQFNAAGIEYEIIPKIDQSNIEQSAKDIIKILDNNIAGESKAIDQFISEGILDYDAFSAEVNKLGLDKPLRDAIINGMVEGYEGGITGISTIVEGKTKTKNVENDVTNFAEWADAQTAEMNLNLNTDSAVAAAQAAKASIDAIFSSLSYAINLSFGIGGLAFRAKGDPGAVKNYDALVGEEGPELIETKNGAYLSGVGGPQITQVHKGDVIHTAKETREIFNRKGVPIPAYKGGTDVDVTGSGGQKTSSKKDKEWENPYDKLYNLLREINEEIRQRERIERRYEKLLENLDVTAQKIVEISWEELAQLEENRRLEEKRIEGRKSQISEYQKENSELNKYGWVEENERGESVLRIDWELIDSIKDPEEGKEIETYISQLEEWFDDLEDAEDSLEEIEDIVEEIKDRGRDEYFDFENAVKEALINSRQEEIDKLEEINDSINNTNTQILDSIRKTIDKQRQDRDNQKTEEELAEKQRRLLYLQQDTSGANDLEILRLQKELEEGQEDYTDTLVDQKISELQEQNEEAAKARQEQIDIMNEQLKFYEETGRVWTDVYEQVKRGIDEQGKLVKGSELEQLLQSDAGIKGMSTIGKMEWMNETNRMIAQGLAYLEIGRQLEDIGVKNGETVEFYVNGQLMTGEVDEYGNVRTKDGYIYDNVFQGVDGSYYAGKNIKSQEELKNQGKPQNNSSKTDKSTETGKNNGDGDKKSKTTYYSATAIDGTVFTKTSQAAADEAANNHSNKIREAFEAYQKGEGYYNKDALISKMKTMAEQSDGKQDKYTNYNDLIKKLEEEQKKKLQESQKKKQQNKQSGGKNVQMVAFSAFATGGLADYTGPAWLDGTKSKPELVLNARDTANFIQLKDILGSIMSRNFSNTNTSTENNGDITYDIDINVETMGSDYDVEQVANKVKNMISDNARYRNNNAISLKR